MNTRKSACSWLRLCLSIIAVCGFAASLGAQTLINIDFGAGSHSLKTGFAATGQSTNDAWNLFRLYDPKYTPGMPLVFSGRLAGLKLADGTATEAAIEVTNAPGVWGNATGDPMYDSYIFAPDGSNIVVTLSHLDPGRYNFYLYGHAEADASGEQSSVFKLHSAGTNYGPLTTLSAAGWKAANAVAGKPAICRVPRRGSAGGRAGGDRRVAGAERHRRAQRLANQFQRHQPAAAG